MHYNTAERDRTVFMKYYASKSLFAMPRLLDRKMENSAHLMWASQISSATVQLRWSSAHFVLYVSTAKVAPDNFSFNSSPCSVCINFNRWTVLLCGFIARRQWVDAD